MSSPPAPMDRDCTSSACRLQALMMASRTHCWSFLPFALADCVFIIRARCQCLRPSTRLDRGDYTQGLTRPGRGIPNKVHYRFSLIIQMHCFQFTHNTTIRTDLLVHTNLFGGYVMGVEVQRCHVKAQVQVHLSTIPVPGLAQAHVSVSTVLFVLSAQGNYVICPISDI